MARSRNIKPDFFTDEDVVELAPLTRLMFIGMWTLADCEGRLEDRPKQIKLRILPVDDIDVESALMELRDHRFIYRYEVDGKKYIQIRNFAKHQRPHHQEPKSVIPSMTSDNLRTTSDNLSVNRTDCLNMNEDCGLLIVDCGMMNEDTIKTSIATREEIFVECFAENEKRIRSIFPDRDFEAEKETCIAHFRNQPPPLDPYEKIIKWFNRSKPRAPNRQPKTFEQMKQENTINAMKELHEDLDNGRSGLETIFGDGSNTWNSLRDGSIKGEAVSLHHGPVRPAS